MRLVPRDHPSKNEPRNELERLVTRLVPSLSMSVYTTIRTKAAVQHRKAIHLRRCRITTARACSSGIDSGKRYDGHLATQQPGRASTRPMCSKYGGQDAPCRMHRAAPTTRADGGPKKPDVHKEAK